MIKTSGAHASRPRAGKFRMWVIAATASAIAISLGLPLSQTTSVTAQEIEFAVPAAPTGITAKPAKSGGISVSWQKVNANPPVTHYVVHAGEKSCPVVVPATQSKATLPVPGKRSSIRPEVVAINAYGQSLSTVASEPITARGTGTRYKPVQFLQLSDFHGAISASATSAGAARLATAFASDRTKVKPTFTVSSGDNIGGAPVISSLFEELPTIQAMNQMRFDVTTLGNHEHDRTLAHLRSMIDASRFDWVVSNYSTLGPLQGTKRGVQPSIMRTKDGVRVGFVGMNTEDTPEVVGPNNLNYGSALSRSVGITNSIAPVQKQVNLLRKAGAEIVVALLHQGWDENSDGIARGRLVEIASQLKGVDLVYGGHSHQRYLSTVGNASVVQVPNAGQEYSRTLVCLDTQLDRTIGSWARIVTASDIANVTPNPATAALVAGYQTKLASELDQVIGRVDGVLPRGGTPPVERSGETPLGNLAADAVRARYGTQLAILNGGGFRDTLPASGYIPADKTLKRPSNSQSGPYDITLGDVISVLPFGNNAATTTMTGEQLWRALENGVSGYPTEGRFPQISGFKFTFDPTRPEGSRITSVKLSDGTPIAPNATTYTVATVDYMVYGGDGYVNVFNPTKATMREPYVDAVVAALKADLALGRITSAARADGRITRD